MNKNKFFASVALAIPAAFVISTAVVPTADVAAAASITDVVYTVGSQNAALSFETFTAALNAEVLTDLNIKYVKLSDGKYYSFETFTSALNAFGTLAEATDMLTSSSSFSTNLTNVVTGEVDVNTGKVVSTGEVSGDFEVIGIE